MDPGFAAHCFASATRCAASGERPKIDSIVLGPFPQPGKSCRANIPNKTFLPGLDHPAKRLNPDKTTIFSTGTAFAVYLLEPRLGRAWRFARSAISLGG